MRSVLRPMVKYGPQAAEVILWIRLRLRPPRLWLSGSAPQMASSSSTSTSTTSSAVPRALIGSLSNDDGDVNEDGLNAIGLDWQNNNFARASSFFVHFFAVVARLRHENA